VARDARPDPDALLASIKKETDAARRGRLKVFFGMCPGVGKTYAMLQAAQQKTKQGVEVVVGVVETHGRKETEALLEGLAISPRAQFEYKGTVLEEMDCDALVLWQPPAETFAVRTGEKGARAALRQASRCRRWLG